MFHTPLPVAKLNKNRRLLSLLSGVLVVAVLVSALVFSITTKGGAHAAGLSLPRPAHVVIVMEENHAYSQIIGSSSAPYLNQLARQGALFTQSFAITHPSQPNYLALFSGSTQGVTSDWCYHTFSGPNLGSELIAAHESFTGYAESLPHAGSTTCEEPLWNFWAPPYARKHAPWVNFTNVPASDNQPFTSFPSNYSQLPTVSFVIPNEQDDMHSGSVQTADTWLRTHLGGYVQWAQTHNSLLIVTWDEDDNSSVNQIPTIFVGGVVKPGQYSEHITHYSVLRTIEQMYGLPALNNSSKANPITDVWQ